MSLDLPLQSYLSTKSSCGNLQEAYRPQYNLSQGVPLSYPGVPPWQDLGQNQGVPPQKGPRTRLGRTWDQRLGYPRERTWDQRLGNTPGKNLGPEGGKEPGTRGWGTPPPRWTDKQTENITGRRTVTRATNHSTQWLKSIKNVAVIRTVYVIWYLTYTSICNTKGCQKDK